MKIIKIKQILDDRMKILENKRNDIYNSIDIKHYSPNNIHLFELANELTVMS